jgi:hypothetical protein
VPLRIGEASTRRCTLWFSTTYTTCTSGRLEIVDVMTTFLPHLRSSTLALVVGSHSASGWRTENPVSVPVLHDKYENPILMRNLKLFSQGIGKRIPFSLVSPIGPCSSSKEAVHGKLIVS